MNTPVKSVNLAALLSIGAADPRDRASCDASCGTR